MRYIGIFVWALIFPAIAFFITHWWVLALCALAGILAAPYQARHEAKCREKDEERDKERFRKFLEENPTFKEEYENGDDVDRDVIWGYYHRRR